MIKVLLVEDSPVTLVVLKRMLARSPEIEVVATATNGRDGLELLQRIEVDVICTDLHMPVMDGLEFTREVMARRPKPILLVSVSASECSQNAFAVLEAGAVDLYLKPTVSADVGIEKLAAEFIQKVKILSGVRVFKRNGTVHSSSLVTNTKSSTVPGPLSVDSLKIITIGSSTGGPQALQTILGALPEDFSLPILCVQHINEGFLHGLIDWLSALCKIKVEIARPGGLPQPGTAYFPQEGRHLEIDAKGKMVISTAPPVGGHCPSVTVTMTSVARYYGKSSLGVLLTGMGRDGAEGLLEIKRSGGMTIAQDEASSVVFGMPKVAIGLGAASYILPLNEIGSTLATLGRSLQKRGSS